ncbi:thioredoxin domain-containing protein [Desulfotalea psychrophila]|uniref:hypothetical protein n=1 Tax=Desulfotalea psychrophila TaxID=84980 RepID=UPI0002D54EF5|nr:hypothetical protein [Desulfotalea psychrophila]
MHVVEEENAKKDPLREAGLLDLLALCDSFFVTSGKKILPYSAGGEQQELLEKITGRTGNLRAPTLRIGATLYVGYNEELYQRVLATQVDG